MKRKRINQLKFQKEFKEVQDFENHASKGDVFYIGSIGPTIFNNADGIIKTRNYDSLFIVVKVDKDGMLFTRYGKKTKYRLGANRYGEPIQFFGNIYQ